MNAPRAALMSAHPPAVSLVADSSHKSLRCKIQKFTDPRTSGMAVLLACSFLVSVQAYNLDSGSGAPVEMPESEAMRRDWHTKIWGGSW